MHPSSNLYNYKDRSINMRDVDEKLNMVKNKYPLGVYYILKEMLEKSEEHRVSFRELEEKMPTNIKNSSPVGFMIIQESISLTVAHKIQKKDNVTPLIPKAKSNSNASSTNTP